MLFRSTGDENVVASESNVALSGGEAESGQTDPLPILQHSLMRMAERWDVARHVEALYSWRVHGGNASNTPSSEAIPLRTRMRFGGLIQGRAPAAASSCRPITRCCRTSGPQPQGTQQRADEKSAEDDAETGQPPKPHTQSHAQRALYVLTAIPLAGGRPPPRKPPRPARRQRMKRWPWPASKSATSCWPRRAASRPNWHRWNWATAHGITLAAIAAYVALIPPHAEMSLGRIAFQPKHILWLNIALSVAAYKVQGRSGIDESGANAMLSVRF